MRHGRSATAFAWAWRTTFKAHATGPLTGRCADHLIGIYDVPGHVRWLKDRSTGPDLQVYPDLSPPGDTTMVGAVDCLCPARISAR